MPPSPLPPENLDEWRRGRLDERTTGREDGEEECGNGVGTDRNGVIFLDCLARKGRKVLCPPPCLLVLVVWLLPGIQIRIRIQIRGLVGMGGGFLMLLAFLVFFGFLVFLVVVVVVVVVNDEISEVWL